MSRAYLDHAASSPVLPAAVEAMRPLLGVPGNPSSLHTSGRTMRRHLEEARESLAADLGARPAEVVLTSGGTEANNLALLGSLPYLAEGASIAVSAVEHPSVADVGQRWPRLVHLPVDPGGHLDLSSCADLLPGVGLISVMWVNNETGAIQPITDVTELARGTGARVHSDAVQAFGHLPIDFAASGLDLMSISAHKIGGPVGIGALVVRRGVPLRPVGFGGQQEAEIRSGTVPVALAAGFAAAARQASERLRDESRRLASLRERVLSGLPALVPEATVNGTAPVSPAILNITVPGTRADDVLLGLDAAGIDCSTGSACSAGVHQPSEVLLAMGRSMAHAAASLRFSFGPSTTTADVQALLAALPAAVRRARAAFGA